MSISEHKQVSEADAPARRIEIFAGAGRRRTWSAEQKAAIVAESCESGARVCEVARRHGLTPQQLFAWWREARVRPEGGADAPPFATAIVAAADPSVASAARPEAPELPSPRSHAIELDIEGTSVWIWREAEVAMVTAIIAALKAAK
jgi:transposase